jgi:hypothetical protein
MIRAASKRLSTFCILRQSQVKFTPFPNEPVGWIIENSGAEMLLFSTDYPHPEGTKDPIGRFEATMGQVSEQAKERFYSRNFAEMMVTSHDLSSSGRSRGNSCRAGDEALRHLGAGKPRKQQRVSGLQPYSSKDENRLPYASGGRLMSRTRFVSRLQGDLRRLKLTFALSRGRDIPKFCYSSIT